MAGKIFADLHNHSTASDGEFTPTQLVEKAKDIGLGAVALTDHDTIEGTSDFLQTGATMGMKVLPGVEVSLAFKRDYFVGTLHLLLYLPEQLLGDKKFTVMLNEILAQGRGLPLVESRVESINRVFGPQGEQPKLKNPLKVEELVGYSPNVTRRHFALALKEKHGIENKNEISEIIGNDSPAYIPSGLDMNLLRPLFAEYNVLRVLAHPAAGSFPGESHYKEVLPPVEIVEKIFPEFLDLGLDGIEVFYPGHTEAHQQLMMEWAKNYSLVITGGSDCHDTRQRPLGVSGLDEGEFRYLMEKLSQL